ncbi:MerR family transcriptional regulator [Hafnia alvei]|uniref:MerR family transcriptional regulator n=1 Tax=Hafnia alvei TaxID=569 RepID=UPI00345DCE3B
MARYFSIGEMSKLHMISVQALRYYDKIELFKPAYVDKESNYRYYTIEQFSVLDTIKYLKYLDIPLKEIRKHLTDSDDKILELLKRKVEFVENKIRHLELIKKVLTTKKETIQNSIYAENVGEITRKHIPSRSVLSIGYEPGLNYEDAMGFSRRKIANILEENISIFYGGVSGILSIKNITTNKKVTYENSFVVVERDLFNEKAKKKITEIPDGDFICITYRGPYKDNYNSLKKIINYVEYKRIPVEDNVYEIPIIDPLSTGINKGLLTEIQIRVQKREIDLRCLV